MPRLVVVGASRDQSLVLMGSGICDVQTHGDARKATKTKETKMVIDISTPTWSLKVNP